MKKLTFSIIADAVFLFFGGGLLLFALLRFRFGAPLSAGIAALVAFAAALWSARRKSRKYAGAALLLSEEKACAGLMENLPLLTGSVRGGIERALRQEAAERARKKAEVEENGEEQAPPLCKFFFRYAPLSPDDAAQILRAARPAEAVFTARADPAAKVILESRGVTVYEGADIYRALADRGALPAIPEKTKPDFKQLFRATFRKKRAGHFLLLGVLLLLFSLIVPFPVYYLVSGGLFVLYALTARLFGKSE